LRFRDPAALVAVVLSAALTSCIVLLHSVSSFEAMAFGIGRALTAPLAVLNFILYFIAACLAGSVLNHNLDHGNTLGQLQNHLQLSNFSDFSKFGSVLDFVVSGICRDLDEDGILGGPLEKSCENCVLLQNLHAI